MSEITTLLQVERRESLRIMGVVQNASDAAYRARVSRVLALLDPEATLRARESGIVLNRWIALRRSTRAAASPEEFQAFARALGVSARWLATGAGAAQQPPAGWSPFGAHGDRPALALEFSDTLGEDLLPLWERPRVEAFA